MSGERERELNEADRRLTLESEILAVVSSHGGEVILAGPAMERMVREIADRVDARPDLVRAALSQQSEKPTP